MPTTVTIMSEQIIRRPVAPGETHDVVGITYSTPTRAPRTVYIESSKDTPEERQRVIAEDLQKAAAAKTQTLDLP